MVRTRSRTTIAHVTHPVSTSCRFAIFFSTVCANRRD
ncbi:hypothetical protein V6Z12_A11G252500 [Gossypium hirsutum]